MKVEFIVTSESKQFLKVIDLMKSCDLGIDGGTMPIVETNSWDTSAKVDKKYLKKMAKVLEKSYLACDKIPTSITHTYTKGNKTITEEYLTKKK